MQGRDWITKEIKLSKIDRKLRIEIESRIRSDWGLRGQY